MITDTISEGRLMQLHPNIRGAALAAYRESVRITPHGVHPFITETLRSFERSDELYQQGRTKPGNIVTNARAGQSMHNYGLALDFVIMVNEKMVWKVDENWMKVVNAFKKYGFAWGGDWKTFKDYPHLEFNYEKTWKELYVMYQSKKFIQGTQYLIV